VAGFYAARSRVIPPLPWPSFAPPFPAQTRAALSRVADPAATVLFAYEPVWAIGSSGAAATPDQAARIGGVIRNAVSGRLAAPSPVLYGGSVTVQNAAAFLHCAAIDGLFVGRSGWSADGFSALLCAPMQ